MPVADDNLEFQFDRRFTDLEMRFAFQEQAIAEMSDALAAARERAARPGYTPTEGDVNAARDAFLKLDPAQPAMKEIMDLQRASKFIATQNSNYDGIEAAARSGYLQWMFRPVRGGVWADVAEDLGRRVDGPVGGQRPRVVDSLVEDGLLDEAGVAIAHEEDDEGEQREPPAHRGHRDRGADDGRGVRGGRRRG